jgi:hypothetical protein
MNNQAPSIPGKTSRPIAVKKGWLKIGERDILIESTPWPEVKTQMKSLPPSPNPLPAVQTNASSGSIPLGKVSHRTLPSWSPNNGSSKQMQLAKASRSGPMPGLVLDYVLQDSEGFDFLGDTTYYVYGEVDLRGGLVTFQPGTVVKYAEEASIIVTDVQSFGEPYRPVILTGLLDDSVGEFTEDAPHYGLYESWFGSPALRIQGTTADLNTCTLNLPSKALFLMEPLPKRFATANLPIAFIRLLFNPQLYTSKMY